MNKLNTSTRLPANIDRNLGHALAQILREIDAAFNQVVDAIAGGLGGTPGADGATGAQGPIGPPVFFTQDAPEPEPFFPLQGLTGSAGATGAPGPTGPAVFLLEDGQDGQDGVPGPTGATGAIGTTGAQGPLGPAIFLLEDGQDGQDGVPGQQGATGAVGSAGVQGPAGADGSYLLVDIPEQEQILVPPIPNQDPRIGAYAPGSFNIPNGFYSIMSGQLILTGTQYATLQGTAQLRIT